MSEGPVVARIGDGVYRVVVNGRAHLAYVAGSGAEVWLHWNGQVFHRPFDDERAGRQPRRAACGAPVAERADAGDGPEGTRGGRAPLFTRAIRSSSSRR